MKRLFITGSDTGIGKTVVSCGMVRGLVAAGRKVAAFKPVASGCQSTPEGLRNEDALALQEAANAGPGYGQVNPWAFAPPVAPHLAAAECGVDIDPARFAAIVKATRADYALIEGVGGWAVPLSEKLMLADLVRVCADAVVLVVGMRLGCVNHGLLSARAILADGFVLTGWVANFADPQMLRPEANLQALRERMPVPLLGQVPYLAQPRSYVAGNTLLAALG